MAVFDHAHFIAMTGGDRALQIEVIGLFKGQVDAWVKGLADGEGWRAAVHTMKGSARGIGLHALAKMCETAEEGASAANAAALVQPALKEALLALEQFAAEAS